MRALLLERNKKVSRRLVRLFTSAGYDAEAVDDPEAVTAVIGDSADTITVLGADAFDGDMVAKILSENTHIRGILWTAEPLKRALRYMIDTEGLSNICGRKDFESPPRPWELLMIARRLRDPGSARTKFSDFLYWGYSGFQEQVESTAHRDDLVARVEDFVDKLGLPRRVGESLGELSHELLMNAMFDAPVDHNGKHKYAADRKASLQLPADEQPLFRVASDGTRLAVQVIDSFGRLRRSHVFNGLARGLEGGEMDTSHGGAGLGMVVCHNSTVAMFYDVQTDQQTQATGIFDMDLNLREFRIQAKSLHFFQTPGRPASPTANSIAGYVAGSPQSHGPRSASEQTLAPTSVQGSVQVSGQISGKASGKAAKQSSSSTSRTSQGLPSSQGKNTLPDEPSGHGSGQTPGR